METKTTSGKTDLQMFFFITAVYSCERVFSDKWIDVAAGPLQEYFSGI